MLEVLESGAVRFDGTMVGEYDASEKRLVLNAGWLRLAGLKLTVEGDPKTDRRRILLARPDDNKRLEGGDQTALPLNGDKEETDAAATA